MTLLICAALLAQGAASDANLEYKRAAEVVALAKSELEPPNSGDILAWAERAVKRYGAACDWVAAGNKKEFSSSANEEVPVLPAYRSIGYLFEAKVFQSIADGKPNQAADALVDVLTFGRRVQTIGTQGYGIGSEIIERNLRMFDLNRRAFAEDGLEKLSKLELIQLIPAERYVRGSDFSNKEERLWPSDLDAIWARAIVMRTKLRLLSATAAVLLHEVRNYKLPDEFTVAYDPATGAPFFYGKRDDAFVIYSNGTEKTGRIELGTLWVGKR